jgi:hypothetical protein
VFGVCGDGGRELENDPLGADSAGTVWRAPCVFPLEFSDCHISPFLIHSQLPGDGRPGVLLEEPALVDALSSEP